MYGCRTMIHVKQRTHSEVHAIHIMYGV